MYHINSTPVPGTETNGSYTNLTIPPAVSAAASGRWRPEIEVWTANGEINDTSPEAHISFRLTSPLNISYGVWLQVYDPGDSLIVSHFIGYFTPGEYDMFDWNGIDDNDEPVSTGTYRIEGVATYTSYLFERQWGSYGSGTGEFNIPIDVAVGPDGYVYVSDFYNNRVQVFDRAGVYHTEITSSTLGGNLMMHPRGIALDNDSNLYVVSDGYNPVKKISPEGEMLAVYGTTGLAAGSIVRADSVAIDFRGTIWVTDTAKSELERYSLTPYWYGPVRNTNYMLFPRGMTSAWNNVYVASQGKNWISVFAIYPVQCWPGVIGSGYLSGPMDVAFGPDHRLYVCDLGDYVTVFAPNGQFLTAFGGSGTDPGKFNQPNGIAVDEDGNIYVADSSNNRIQKFTSDRHTADNSTTVRVTTGYRASGMPATMPFTLDLKPGSSVPDWIFLSGEYAPATPTPVPVPAESTEPVDISAFLDANGTPSIDPAFDMGELPAGMPGVETPSTAGRDAFLAMMDAAAGSTAATAGESNPTPVPVPVSASPASPAMTWALVPLSLIAVVVIAVLRNDMAGKEKR